MLFHIYVCLVIDCSFVILLCLMLFIMFGLSFASYMPYIIVRSHVVDAFLCHWFHKTRGIENYYCGHAPCAATCSICCFLGAFPLGSKCHLLHAFPIIPSTTPNLLSLFLLHLLIPECWILLSLLRFLVFFSCKCLQFQFSFPAAEAFHFVFSIWGFAFVSFLLKYF